MPVKSPFNTFFISPILLCGRGEFEVVVNEVEQGSAVLLGWRMTFISFSKAITRDLVSSVVMFSKSTLEKNISVTGDGIFDKGICLFCY